MNVNIYDKTTKLCVMGMLSALSIVLVFLVRIPILPEAPYLEYDPADIPILITSYLYGPISGLAVTLIVCILQGITFSSGSGIIGILMHFFATGAMCMTVGLIAEKSKFNFRAIAAGIAGGIMMILIMVPLNMIFTPLYTGMSTKDIAKLILPVFIPFNGIKSGINVTVALIVYAAILPVLNIRKKKESATDKEIETE